MFSGLSDSASTMCHRLKQCQSRRSDKQNLQICAAALLCAVLPLEITHLVAALIGVVGYMVLQALQPAVDYPKPRPIKTKAVPATAQPQRNIRSFPASKPSRTTLAPRVEKPPEPKPSVAPVAAPKFASSGLADQIEELLPQLLASTQSDDIIAQITQRVKKDINAILPEAEVAGYASGNVLNGAAFGVAVPELDIVISLSPYAMSKSLQGRWTYGPGSGPRLDARKLTKSAIRACTDQLVATGAFKFRRSAFRGEEPRVTLIARAFVNGAEANVPINVCVNAVTPMYSAALVSECGQLDARAKALILFVRRWAKDRGLSQVAKGHLSPYAWTLLTIYYLQVAGDRALLPALTEFQMASELIQGKQRKKPIDASERPHDSPPVACMFSGMLHFYNDEFDWKREAVCPRVGQRSGPPTTLPIHIVVSEDGLETCAAPSVEDPFERSCNLASGMNAASFARLHAELARAHEMCLRGDSLSMILEPWSPPESQECNDADKENATKAQDEP